jgi:hypothetical protein
MTVASAVLKASDSGCFQVLFQDFSVVICWIMAFAL